MQRRCGPPPSDAILITQQPISKAAGRQDAPPSGRRPPPPPSPLTVSMILTFTESIFPRCLAATRPAAGLSRPPPASQRSYN